MYNPKSTIATEFISDSEIRSTMEYAVSNCSDRVLIDGILAKAAEAKGLSHREAALLLECNDPDVTARIFSLANEIKHRFYGNRIVMFAPLYLSNYCVNGCVYCPYHAKNKTIHRKKLTQEEIRAEVIALQDMGHKRLALEAGEDPLHNPLEYILESIKTIYSIKHKNGAIRRVNVNIAATKVEEKINASLTKLGLTGDQISFTFNADNTYSATIKGRLVQGTYALDVENNKITLTYLNGLGTITPQISKTGNTLSLLYDADKLLIFLTSVASVSNNSTLTTLNALLKSYDGMLIGMELQK